MAVLLIKVAILRYFHDLDFFTVHIHPNKKIDVTEFWNFKNFCPDYDIRHLIT